MKMCQITKKIPKKVQHFAKYKVRLFKCCHFGKISPNLVTLYVTEVLYTNRPLCTDSRQQQALSTIEQRILIATYASNVMCKEFLFIVYPIVWSVRCRPMLLGIGWHEMVGQSSSVIASWWRQNVKRKMNRSRSPISLAFAAVVVYLFFFVLLRVANWRNISCR